MESLLGAYSDYYAAILLLIPFLIILFRRDYYAFHEKLMLWMISATFFLLILEGTSFLVDGVNGVGFYIANLTLNALLFALTPVIAALWACYIDYKLYSSVERLQKHWYYSQPLLITVAMMIVNAFTPFLFSINEQNEFQREVGINISIIVLSILALYLLIQLLRQHELLNRQEKSGLVALLTMPAIGGGIQMAYIGFSSLYSMLAIGLLAAYILIENIGINKDDLTGLFSRKKAFQYIQNRIIQHRTIDVILLDIDELKQINDAFGHRTGDTKIMTLTKLMQKHFPDDALLARTGGDEFLIVMDTRPGMNIIDITQRVQTELESTVNMNVSFGHVCTRELDHPSLDDILHITDQRMYEQKAEHKNYKRRRTDR